MGRGLILGRRLSAFPLTAVAVRTYSVLPRVSTSYPQTKGRSPTCYSPVRHSRAGCPALPSDLHDVKVPSVLILISYWVIGLPLGYWLGFHAGLGPVGIWTGLLIGLTLTASAMLWRFHSLTRRLQGL